MNTMYRGLAFFMLNILFFGNISAQKVRSEQLLVNYIQLPLKPLPKDIKTYYSEIKSAFLSPQKNDMYREKYLKLSGYQQTARNEDLTITVEFERMNISEEEIVSTWNPKRPDDPRYFYYKISYTLPHRFSVTTRDGNEIYYDEGACGQTYHYEFGRRDKFVREKDLHEAYQKQRTKSSQDKEENAIKTVLKKIQTLITDEMAFVNKSSRFHVAIAKGKHDYSDLKDALGHMEEGLGAISRRVAEEEANTHFRKAINIWKNALKESNLNNKKSRINAHVTSRLYYNCALAYMWMNDFENAIYYANLSEQNKIGFSFRGVWNVPIRSMIRDRKRRFEANH